jgi:hypothetical protein
VYAFPLTSVCVLLFASYVQVPLGDEVRSLDGLSWYGLINGKLG